MDREIIMKTLVGLAVGGAILAGAYCFNNGCGSFEGGREGVVNENVNASGLPDTQDEITNSGAVYNGNGADLTMEECRTNDGVWKRWGISDEESCNIITTDFGKLCYDIEECQGFCITNCVTSDCLSDVGECSEYKRYFGCTRMWLDGEQERFYLCRD